MVSSKKLIFYVLLILGAAPCIHAQKYFTKAGVVSFYSETPVENIEAHNKSSNCVFDLETGAVAFAVLIKGFHFKKALMQEHFNENYMESNKYPNATFKGQIENYKKIDPTKNGKATVKIKGDLTIHGVTKPIVTDAEINVVNGKIDADAQFNIAVADYNISVPALVKNQIAKSILVKVDSTLEPLTKKENN
jgi:hypothetical protein